MKWFKKLRALSKTKWRDLSTGGKVKKVLLRLAELVFILTFGMGILAFVAFTVFMVMILAAICGGAAEGFSKGCDSVFNNQYHSRYW